MEEVLGHVGERLAALIEQERTAFKAAWRWSRRVGGKGVVILCDPKTSVVVLATAESVADCREGNWLWWNYQYFNKVRTAHEELQRRRAARRGRALDQGWGSVPFDSAAEREADHDLPGDPRPPGRLAGADRRPEDGRHHPGRAAGAGGPR